MLASHGGRLAGRYAEIQQAQGALARLTPTQVAVPDVAEAQVDSATLAEALAQTQVDSCKPRWKRLKHRPQITCSSRRSQGRDDTGHSCGRICCAGVVVALFADTSKWQIETTDLTKLNIAKVSEGTPATMTFDAIPDLELTGNVTPITPYGESKQGDIDYTVTITPDQQDPRLRWNMTAKVSIEPKQ